MATKLTGKAASRSRNEERKKKPSSSSPSSDYLGQLSSIKNSLLDLQKKTSLPAAPAGEVLGASTTSGGGSSALKDFSINNSPGNQITQDDAEDLSLKSLSKKLAKQYYGSSDNAKKASDEIKRNAQMGQTSANTTFAFNPETLKRTQREIDKFGFALDELDNDPFEPKEFKDEERKNTVEVSGRELGKLFDSPEQLYDAYQFNLPMKAALDNFIKKGGSLDAISKNITAPVVNDGMTEDNRITNEMVDRGELPESAREIYPQQSSSQYLANLRNPAANQAAEKKALDELAPESQIAQDEIARLGRVPDSLKKLYFGDEKTIGMLGMKINQAKEEARIIEEKEKDAKNTARSRADLAIDKNRAEAKQFEAEIEQNRLKAKNYMTGALAKLGALKTTGSAPLAIATLDAEYDGQVTQIKSKYKYANRELEIGLTEDLDKIENDTDESILKLQEDLTLDTEKMSKEVIKAQQDAEKQVYTVTEQYARRLRERTTSYTEDLKKEAEKYAKEYAKKVAAAGAGGFTSAGKPTSKNYIISKIEKRLDASRGSDGYVNSSEYAAAMEEWIASGGTAATFKTSFPTANYANPEDTSLPPALRYAKPSQTVSSDDEDDFDFDAIPEE